MTDMDPSNNSEHEIVPSIEGPSQRVVTRLGNGAVDLSGLRSRTTPETSVGLMTYDSAEMADAKLLYDLVEVVEANLNRHLEKRGKGWKAHKLIPYSEGRNYDGPLGGEAWDPSQSRLSDVAQFAMILNLLTEDNLPSYHHVIRSLFPKDGPWKEWVGRWTAEEANHSIGLRDYLVVTRGVDPTDLEEARMAQMVQGYDSGGRDVLRTLAYVTMQELATNVAHRNTGKACNDPVASRLLGHIAGDERLHMIFYSNLVEAAFELQPDRTMQAITDEVIGFEMPGANMQGFEAMANEIAVEGIYDKFNHHFEVVMPALNTWKVFERTGLSSEGEKARERLAAHLQKAEKQALMFNRLRPRFAAALAARKAAANS